MVLHDVQRYPWLYPLVELNTHCICSKYRELDEHSIYENIVCKIESLHNKVKPLEVSVNELTVKCKRFREDLESSMEDFECLLWRILDDIGVKRQAHHENVFVGNHCKLILAKDGNGVFNFLKLCSVLPDKSLKKFFSLIF